MFDICVVVSLACGPVQTDLINTLYLLLLYPGILFSVTYSRLRASCIIGYAVCIFPCSRIAAALVVEATWFRQI